MIKFFLLWGFEFEIIRLKIREEKKRLKVELKILYVLEVFILFIVVFKECVLIRVR